MTLSLLKLKLNGFIWTKSNFISILNTYSEHPFSFQATIPKAELYVWCHPNTVKFVMDMTNIPFAQLDMYTGNQRWSEALYIPNLKESGLGNMSVIL